MMLKSLDRSAKIAFGPSGKRGTLLASGTVAGTIDDAFDSKSQLEIYDTNLGDPSNNLKLLGSVVCKDSFYSIAWGSKGTDDGTFAHGLIAGGMSDGSVNIWNCDSIIQQKQDALLHRADLHKGQVLGLEFNPKQPNLLASGATDGEVYIYDLLNPREPKPSKLNPHSKADSTPVTALSWNRKMAPIIATGDELGETKVYDLRQKRAVLTVHNHGRMRVRVNALSWNPDQSVQMAVAYNHHVVEIWDLRQHAPKMKLQNGHTGSVVGLDWCPHDAELLITSGDDCKTLGWNPLKGELLCEYPTSVLNYDVRWCPTHPSLISSCSDDGKVTLQSIHYAGPHVPKWVPRPTGAAFGFGGRLVTFGTSTAAEPVEGAAEQNQLGGEGQPATKTPVAPKPVSTAVTITQCVTDPELLQLSESFHQQIQRNDWASFCAAKIAEARTPEEKQTWTFMSVLIEQRNQKANLLKELGYQPPVAAVEESPKAESAPAAEPQQTNAADEIPEDSFFDSITPTAEPSVEVKAPVPVPMKPPGPSVSFSSLADFAGPGGPEETAEDQAIRAALIVGDFKTAVAKCLAANRQADALMFASCAGGQLWDETRNTFLRQHRSPFIRTVMRRVIDNDIQSLVEQADLANWRESLAIIITYTRDEPYRLLVNQLAARLEPVDKHAATLCYMCASNVDKVVELWSAPGAQSSAESRVVALHHAIEKIAVFTRATNLQNQPLSSAVNAKYSEYAALLAQQGALTAALDYMRVVNPRRDDTSSVLVDRVFRALPALPPGVGVQAPPFPWPLANIQPDPSLGRVQQRAPQQQPQAARQPSTGYPGRAPSSPAGGYGTQQPPQQQQYAPGPGAPGGPRAASGYPPQTQQAPQSNNWSPRSAGAPPQQPYPAQPSSRAPMPGGPQQGGYPPQQGGFAESTPAPAAGGPPYAPRPPDVAPPGFNPSNLPPQNLNRGPYPGPAGPQGGYNPQPSPTYGQQQPQGYPAPGQQQQGGYPPHPQPSPHQHQQPHQPYQPPQPQPQPAYPPQPQRGQPPMPGPSQPSYAPAPGPAYPPQHQQPAGPVPSPYPAQPQQTPFPPQPQRGMPAAGPSMSSPQEGFPPAAAVPAPAPRILQPKAAEPAPVEVPASRPAPTPAPAPAATPAALSGEQQRMADILDGVVSSLMGNANVKAPDQKKLADVQKRLGLLYGRLVSGELKDNALTEVTAMVAAIGSGDYDTATKHHTNLVNNEWNNNQNWLPGVKTLLLLGKKYA